MTRSPKLKRTVKRSPLYHLLHTISPINHGASAKVDLLGTAIVIGIIIGGVFLMRTLLAVQ